MEVLRIGGYLGLIAALVLAVDAKDTANKVQNETQALVLFLQCQNNQARNRILIHVVESIIIQRQIDLLYSTDNGQYAYNNTELYILENEADALRAQNKESCLGNLRRGVYGAVVKPPDMQP